MAKTQIDSHRLSHHPRRVADWLEGKNVYPIYVEVGPTNRCNHRCAFCALDWLSHGGSDLDTDCITAALVDMAGGGVKSVMFAGEGEPFLHRDIGRMIQTARQVGLDVAVTTNGSLFDAKTAEMCLPCLAWMRVSLDAGTPETYAKIHGVSLPQFDKVLENLLSAVEIKRQNRLPVTIGVQVLMIPQNLGELETITARVKSIGVDNIQFKPYSHHPSSNNDFSIDYATVNGLENRLRALSDETFDVYYRRGTIERITGPRGYDACHGLTFFALIDSRANVIPCNLFYNDPEFTYGNLTESCFAQIWNSPRRMDVIRRIHHRGTEACRQGCRLDAANRYLAELRNPHPHVNFI